MAQSKNSAEELLRACNDQSGQSRNTWFTFLLLGTYLAVTAGSTSHWQLLLEAPVALPLLGVTLPMVAFFKIAPLLFVLTHFFMLVQLYLLSRTLHAFNAALREEEAQGSPQPALRTQLDSFPVTQLIAGVPTDWAANLFVKLSCWVTLLFAPIVLLLEFQIQFLAYHDVGTTYIHRAAIVVDLLICWLLWPAILHPGGEWKAAWERMASASVAFLGGVRRWFGSRKPSPEAGPASAAGSRTFGATMRAVSTTAASVLILALSLATIGFSFLLATIPGEALEAWMALRVGDVESTTIRQQCGVSGDTLEKAKRVQPLRPLVCLGSLSVWFGARTTNDDAHLAANGLPAKWRVWWPTAILFEGSIANDEDEAKRLRQSFEDGKGADVANKSQQPGNFFTRNLTLSGQSRGPKSSSDDRTISLAHRDLRFARLYGADLAGAELTGADLTGADLTLANLKGANMPNLIATSARFLGAVLDGVKLDGAWLQGSNFSAARLRRASLREAHLQGAALRRISGNHANFDLADLRAAQLRGAVLTDASMDSTNLDGSDLSSADLDRVELFCANLKAVDLSEANLAATVLTCEDNPDVMRSVDLRKVSFDPAAAIDEYPDFTVAGGEPSRSSKRPTIKQHDITSAKKTWEPFLKGRNPKTEPNKTELAKQLTDIACQGDVFTAAGVLVRIEIEEDDGADDKAFRQTVAKSMADGDCPPAKLMSRANRERLQRTAEGQSR